MDIMRALRRPKGRGILADSGGRGVPPRTSDEFPRSGGRPCLIPDRLDGATRVQDGFITRLDDKAAIITLEDLHGQVDAVIFPDALAQHQDLVAPDQAVFLKGRVDFRREQPSIRTDQVIALAAAAQKLTSAVYLRLKCVGLEERRLGELREHYGVMEASLAEGGRYEIEGVAVEAHARIPAELFGRAKAVTRDMYGFDADWVPGFFVDMAFGWFFGGCAFHFFPDFFTLFMIRRSFAERERWLIYDRDELLAHEMCHVARVALDSTVFEEVFA